jgi:integrase
VKSFGKRRAATDLIPDDFAALRATLEKSLGPTALGNEIVRVRTIFKYAAARKWIPTAPDYGPEFAKPEPREIAAVRRSKPKRMFQAAEIRTILDALDGYPVTLEAGSEPQVFRADPIMRAAVLLGINCGFGQTDVATLPIEAININRGWVEHPRPKTGADRNCPLWPETVAALKRAIAVRPAPKNPADDKLAFLTMYGRPFVRLNRSGTPDDELGKEFAKLLRRLKLKRQGLSFYGLRHTFRTVADEALDYSAVGFIMGHSRQDMAARYIEGIDPARLVRVTDHVKRWLFPSGHVAAAQSDQLDGPLGVA